MLKYFQHRDEMCESNSVGGAEANPDCGSCESETPGAFGTSTLADEQGSSSFFSESEKDLDTNVSKHEAVNLGEDNPKIGVHEEVCTATDEDVENLREAEPSHCRENNPRQLQSNPKIVVDEVNRTFDPASLVGLKLRTEDKEQLIKMDPCQPGQSTLKLRKKKFGQRSRYCSQQVFFHDDGTRRKWISYSLSTDSLFCIPCLLFTDPLSQGELARANQGNAFTVGGFSNWRKQHSVVEIMRCRQLTQMQRLRRCFPCKRERLLHAWGNKNRKKLHEERWKLLPIGM